ncbi:MAG: hypothetical protein WCX82_04585 [archaeon]|jgi:hypothetical protein
MSSILLTILNYVWVFIKLLLFSAVASLPFIGITYLLKTQFLKLRTKKLSYALSLYILIYIISFIGLVFIYFIPILDKFSTFTFLNGIGFVVFQLIRLLLINLLLSAMMFIIAMFISLLYDSFIEKKDKKKKVVKVKIEKLSFLNLWKSFSMVFFVMFLFILIVFPSLIAMIMYLIFM